MSIYQSQPIPTLSQYQGTQYIKQLEDIVLPQQPYTDMGFPRRGMPLVPATYMHPTHAMTERPLHRDFLPFHQDFNIKLFNPKTGYTEAMTYPFYQSGVRGYGF
jgi:hypothetical protein